MMRWAAVPFGMVAIFAMKMAGMHWGPGYFAILSTAVLLGFFAGLSMDLTHTNDSDRSMYCRTVREFITQENVDKKHDQMVGAIESLMGQFKAIPKEKVSATETPEVLALRDQRARLLYEIKEGVDRYNETFGLMRHIVESQISGTFILPTRVKFDWGSLIDSVERPILANEPKPRALGAGVPIDELMECPNCGHSARWLSECGNCGGIVDDTGFKDEIIVPKKPEKPCDYCGLSANVGEKCPVCGMVVGGSTPHI